MGNSLSSRKLAVILHADVVGSIALVQQDEALAHRRIVDLFRRFARTIEAYGGVVHETRGDALVAEFGRASDAVCAALAFQRANGRFNAGLNDRIRPALRVGVSLGEVVVADCTVTGPGVVLAQRVEQLAGDGGVCVTEAIHEAAPRRLPLAYASLGEHLLKGFEESTRVYAVTLNADAAVPPPEPRPSVQPGVASRVSARRRAVAAAGTVLILVVGLVAWWQPWTVLSPAETRDDIGRPPADRRSIVVLPFESLADDTTQDYFSDGLTEDLITNLTQLSGLFVVSRKGAFRYKQRGVALPDIGRELGVQNVFAGSVRRERDKVRITAQLVDVQTGAHLWAQRYEGELKDIFALQDEITRSIVAALSVTLTDDDKSRLARHGTTSIEAYDLYLRARAMQGGNTRDRNAEARRLLEQAIALDPEFARAHAELSWVQFLGWLNSWREPTALGEALSSAREALSLNDRLPEAYARLGWAQIWDRQYEEGIATAKRSIEIDPNYADGYLMLGHVLIYGGGSAEEAIRLSKKGMELDPYNTYHYLVHIADGYWMLGRREEALEHLRRSVRLEPDFMPGHLWLAALHAELGNLDEARAAIADVRRLSPEASIQGQRRILPYKDAVVRERFLDALRKAGLPE